MTFRCSCRLDLFTQAGRLFGEATFQAKRLAAAIQAVALRGFDGSLLLSSVNSPAGRQRQEALHRRPHFF